MRATWLATITTESDKVKQRSQPHDRPCSLTLSRTPYYSVCTLEQY